MKRFKRRNLQKTALFQKRLRIYEGSPYKYNYNILIFIKNYICIVEMIDNCQ